VPGRGIYSQKSKLDEIGQTRYHDKKVYKEVNCEKSLTLMGDRVMKTINQITIEELENLIEQKIIEILGDPDTNLELREDFKEEIKTRLASRSKRASHQEVMKRFG
jgi:hypothetical protein